MKTLNLSRKFILGFVLFAIIDTLAIVALGCVLFRMRMVFEIHQEACQLAEAVKASIPDGELRNFAAVARSVYHDEMTEAEAAAFTDSISYKRISSAVNDLREQFGAADIYVVGLETEAVDAYLADPAGAHSPAYSIIDYDSTEDAMSFGEEMRLQPEFMQIMVEANQSGKEPSQEIVGNSERGYCIYAYVPVLVRDGGDAIGIGTALYLENMIAGIREFVWFSLISSMIITVVGSLIFLRYQMRAVINPIRLVSGEAVRFTDDQLHSENAESIALSERLKSIKTQDELQDLSESVYHLESGIVTFARDIKRMTAEQERINADLDLAKQIQSDVLPNYFPAFPERDEFDIYAFMTPAREVGGDFYDFFMTDEDHLALVIADVSGKGVPAALFMMIAKALIKTNAQAGMSPGETLARVNDQLVEGNDSMLFVTVWMAVIELGTGEGIAVNAAHEHPVLRRAGGQYELVEYEHSLAVGFMPQTDYEEHGFHLGPGDALFVYTDGVAEAGNAVGERFETERLCEVLNEDPDRTPKELCECVEKAITAFAAGEEQFDDITMLSFVMHTNR